MIYMSIVIINKPDKAAEMLRYMSLIREVSQNGGYAWRTYDTQFRIRLAVYPAPWSVINQDLWNRCFPVHIIGKESSVETQVSNSTYKVPSAAQPSKGKCINFNSGLCTFPNCKFLHVCSVCGLGHSKVNCMKFDPVSFNRGRGAFRRPQGRGFGSFRRNYGRGYYR